MDPNGRRFDPPPTMAVTGYAVKGLVRLPPGPGSRSEPAPAGIRQSDGLGHPQVSEGHVELGYLQDLHPHPLRELLAQGRELVAGTRHRVVALEHDGRGAESVPAVDQQAVAAEPGVLLPPRHQALP